MLKHPIRHATDLLHGVCWSTSPAGTHNSQNTPEESPGRGEDEAENEENEPEAADKVPSISVVLPRNPAAGTEKLTTSMKRGHFWLVGSREAACW